MYMRLLHCVSEYEFAGYGVFSSVDVHHSTPHEHVATMGSLGFTFLQEKVIQLADIALR